MTVRLLAGNWLLLTDTALCRPQYAAYILGWETLLVARTNNTTEGACHHCMALAHPSSLQPIILPKLSLKDPQN